MTITARSARRALAVVAALGAPPSRCPRSPLPTRCRAGGGPLSGCPILTVEGYRPCY